MVSAGWRYDPITGGSGLEQDGQHPPNRQTDKDNGKKSCAPILKVADRYYETINSQSSWGLSIQTRDNQNLSS
jgi:hypothetical protein